MSSPLHILLVEDNPADARLTREILREARSLDFEIAVARSLGDAVALLAESAFDIVLLDLSLPDAQGLASVRRVGREHPHLPLIVLSGLDDETTAIEALQNGAQDYLVKGQGDGNLMARAMRYAIERKRGELLLTEAKELAEAANRAKTAFLANMSHELRTPLNAIIGFSEIIASEVFGAAAGDRYRQYAGHINASGQHLLRLVNEILDFEKSIAQQFELTEAVVDLGGLLRECTELMSVQAADRGVTVTTVLPDDPPLMTADALRLKQVVLNLLSNAVKFSNADGLVELAVERAEEGDLVIIVGDNGIGMRPQDIPLALEPFRQVDNTLARANEGTGLGLPLAKILAEKHGGRLVVTSRPGQGTTVRVILPGWRLAGPSAAPLLLSA
jgi:signal transduction histidine kinase